MTCPLSLRKGTTLLLCACPAFPLSFPPLDLACVRACEEDEPGTTDGRTDTRGRCSTFKHLRGRVRAVNKSIFSWRARNNPEKSVCYQPAKEGRCRQLSLPSNRVWASTRQMSHGRRRQSCCRHFAHLHNESRRLGRRHEEEEEG